MKIVIMLEVINILASYIGIGLNHQQSCVIHWQTRNNASNQHLSSHNYKISILKHTNAYSHFSWICKNIKISYLKPSFIAKFFCFYNDFDHLLTIMRMELDNIVHITCYIFSHF